MAKSHCQCCDVLFEQFDDWNISEIVAEYGHQFSLDTYSLLMNDAYFGSSGATQKPGHDGNAYVIKTESYGPKILDPPMVCIDFWTGPVVRIAHIGSNKRPKYYKCLTLDIDWYPSLMNILSTSQRSETWKKVMRTTEEPPSEYQKLCDFVMRELDIWLHEQSRKLACPHEAQKMPEGYPSPNAYSIQ